MHENVNALPKGYQYEEFELHGVLGAGTFGITYLGYDHNLQLKVAIKEYFPEKWARRLDDFSVEPISSQDEEVFDWGLTCLKEEAQALAAVRHPNIVRAYRYFTANKTGYIVMEYVPGENLEDVLQREGTESLEKTRLILELLAEGLRGVHARDYLHRDIKPENVIISLETSQPVLIDFGAARQKITNRTRAMTAIVTPGYGPPEQYFAEAEDQGAWTDIYALSALGYRMLSGLSPPEGLKRVNADTLIWLEPDQYEDSSLIDAINAGLMLKTSDRPQSSEEWLKIARSQAARLRQANEEAGGPKTEYIPRGDHASARPKPPLPASGTSRKKKPHGLAKSLPLLAVSVLGIGAIVGLILMGNSDDTETSTGDGTEVVEEAPSVRGDEIVVEIAPSAPSGVFADCLDVCPELATIAAGSFNMGSSETSVGHDPSEGPVRRVEFKHPFAIGVTEVTVSQWQACAANGGCDDLRNMDVAVPLDVSPRSAAMPVRSISWNAMQGYLNWISEATGHVYRLPTEAEWEYAARAGVEAPWSSGANLAPNTINCNGCWSGEVGPISVATFEPNAFGLFDMQGNVWELVLDCWSPNHTFLPDDGSPILRPVCPQRVARGGSYANDPNGVRLARRIAFELVDQETGASWQNPQLGFRVLREFPRN